MGKVSCNWRVKTLFIPTAKTSKCPVQTNGKTGTRAPIK